VLIFVEAKAKEIVPIDARARNMETRREIPNIMNMYVN
jgi:hypothetical protein